MIRKMHTFLFGFVPRRLFEKFTFVMKISSLVSQLCHFIMVFSNHNKILRILLFFFQGNISVTG